eukprot:1205836-Lingulodinium_polyedra.AAC.1
MASTRVSGEYTAVANERLPTPTSTSRSSMAVLATRQSNAPKSGKSYRKHTRHVRHLVVPAGLTLSHDGQQHMLPDHPKCCAFVTRSS